MKEIEIERASSGRWSTTGITQIHLIAFVLNNNFLEQMKDYILFSFGRGLHREIKRFSDY